VWNTSGQDDGCDNVGEGEPEAVIRRVTCMEVSDRDLPIVRAASEFGTNPSPPKAVKSVAASALTQRPNKPSGKR